jgi:hypothetical protein
VIVYNAGRLQVGIYYYAAQKLKTPFFHVSRNRVRQARFCRYVGKCFPFARNLLASGETPNVRGKTAEFFLNFQKVRGVVY